MFALGCQTGRLAHTTYIHTYIQERNLLAEGRVILCQQNFSLTLDHVVFVEFTVKVSVNINMDVLH